MGWGSLANDCSPHNPANPSSTPCRYSKTGDAVFVGHLDLMKAFDRACRRAALPVSADSSPFAARQRIFTALPLGLGE